MQLEMIIYKIFDSTLLTSQPDEWGYIEYRHNLTSIGYATTLTTAVIHQAIDHNIDLIVSHHDCWDFMYEERRDSLDLLEKYQISHIWCHMPLDRADFGTAASLLSSMGCEVIGTLADECGRIGEFQHELELTEVIASFNEQLGEIPCRIHDAGRDISRIVAVPGAGNLTGYLAEARDHEVDLFVTGETSLYLLEYARYLRINVLVYSHNYTENFGTRNLANKIAHELCIEKVIKLDEPHF